MKKAILILSLVVSFIACNKNAGKSESLKTAYIDTAEILLKDLWQYDPNTDTWMQKADLPGAARRDAVAF